MKLFWSKLSDEFLYLFQNFKTFVKLKKNNENHGSLSFYSSFLLDSSTKKISIGSITSFFFVSKIGLSLKKLTSVKEKCKQAIEKKSLKRDLLISQINRGGDFFLKGRKIEFTLPYAFGSRTFSVYRKSNVPHVPFFFFDQMRSFESQEQKICCNGNLGIPIWIRQGVMVK